MGSESHPDILQGLSYDLFKRKSWKSHGNHLTIADRTFDGFSQLKCMLKSMKAIEKWNDKYRFVFL